MHNNFWMRENEEEVTDLTPLMQNKRRMSLFHFSDNFTLMGKDTEATDTTNRPVMPDI